MGNESGGVGSLVRLPLLLLLIEAPFLTEALNLFDWTFHIMKDELHSILSAIVGGARYGVKIRLPHALVMTLLFRRDLSSKDKLKTILKLAYDWSRRQQVRKPKLDSGRQWAELFFR